MDKLNKKMLDFVGTDMGREYADFPNNLNACFKWLVPKARKRAGVTKIDFSYFGDEVGCRLFGGYGALLELSKGVLSKTEAKTLCLAIGKLIDGEKDDSI